MMDGSLERMLVSFTGEFERPSHLYRRLFDSDGLTIALGSTDR